MYEINKGFACLKTPFEAHNCESWEIYPRPQMKRESYISLSGEWELISKLDNIEKLLGKISNNRFSGVGIGAGVTAIIQSSSATSVMVIGLVNAGVMTLMQATPIIMGANIGTTITAQIAKRLRKPFRIRLASWTAP